MQYTIFYEWELRTVSSSFSDSAEARSAVLITSEDGELVGGVRLESMQRQWRRVAWYHTHRLPILVTDRTKPSSTGTIII